MLEIWVKDVISDALRSYLQERGQGEDLATLLPKGIRLEFPKKDGFGDISTPVAMHLSAHLKTPPRKIAESLSSFLSGSPLFQSVEIAGPGYLNFTYSEMSVRKTLLRILDTDSDLVFPEDEKRRVLVEFVSANPTGPLHVGHGRGAAYGDALSRILKAVGHDVTTEYYINDAGNQMEMLGRSTCLAWRKLHRAVPESEEQAFLKGATPYKGDYIREIAQEMIDTPGILSPEESRAALDPEAPETLYLGTFTEYAQGRIMEGIREDLHLFDVPFDAFFSEKILHEKKNGKNSDAVTLWINRIREASMQASDPEVPDVYESEGALWLRTTVLGDDKDRVLLRSDGRLTYFAADIAYHALKIERKFDVLIDVWGADHHGYIPRMNAAVKTLSRLLDHPVEFRVALIQLVSLVRDGRPVSMSTRGGEFVTLREVLDEVGVDATRFSYLSRSHESPLEFDLNKAKERSMDNPVYYVQYAHARVKSLLRQADTRGLSLPSEWSSRDLEALREPAEKDLVKRLDRFSGVVNDVSRTMEVHPMTEYLTDLAGRYHHFYFHHRILSQEPQDRELTTARIALSIAVGRVLEKGLGLLGISAPEVM
ncbi:MAG: Arginyl-tRNA synthetase [Leptospirillum sp. Group II 'C75']|uniref:arginine--tRNA ligase n=1 Tax=Leptospirillum sp. Group II 'CF-1' TaxID=1660083 RepID=UPI0000F0CEF0|nr:arginine--tRNA ligase [Leptospirillum sp. Group II 'CF-1']EAY56166.1 MAG: Arginyl-tRNA synthetase [Leptospirillum rubarum]EIJ75339.1 MAG: Arginyl-tRNA synthetase [Leptospirillum sp. Group II 'C75']